MFVEAEVEVAVTDKTLTSTDEYDLKLWLQRAFKLNACYRISGFKPGAKRSFRATVALNTRVLPEAEWKALEGDQSAAAMRRFVETSFTGKGTCRCVSEPNLKGM
ncbi:MAG: hypothetical protein HY901_07260 [Deltaproteobacteria bacterium]|nr:hypothetical protein [Deltaproteobacteria bacterium]